MKFDHFLVLGKTVVDSLTTDCAQNDCHSPKGPSSPE